MPLERIIRHSKQPDKKSGRVAVPGPGARFRRQEPRDTDPGKRAASTEGGTSRRPRPEIWQKLDEFDKGRRALGEVEDGQAKYREVLDTRTDLPPDERFKLALDQLPNQETLGKAIDFLDANTTQLEPMGERQGPTAEEKGQAGRGDASRPTLRSRREEPAARSDPPSRRAKTAADQSTKSDGPDRRSKTDMERGDRRQPPDKSR